MQTLIAPEPNSAAEQFDAHNPNFTRDRFALMAQMREESPVTFVPSLHVYAVTRWQEVRDVLGDAATFASSEAFSGGVHLAPQALEIFPLSSPFFAMNLINVDKPLHKRLRDPLMAAFHIKRVQALAPSVVADVDELLEWMVLDAIASGGLSEPRTDLLPMLCKPLPLRTICRLMGIPLADAPQLSLWSDALIAFQTPGLPVEVQIEAAQGLKALEDYVRALIIEKTAHPDEGLVSALIEGRAKGENDLSDDELVADIGITFFAGHETTVNTIANAFVSLLENREQWDATVAGTLDADNLVEELLRHDTSVMGLFRRATQNTEIGGVPIPAGAILWVSYGAANRDPAKFESPDELRCPREGARAHLTFEHGAHFCIGPMLARLQLREAIIRAARRFPEMHLAPGAEIHEIPVHGLRAPTAVPVLLQ